MAHPSMTQFMEKNCQQLLIVLKQFNNGVGEHYRGATESKRIRSNKCACLPKVYVNCRRISTLMFRKIRPQLLFTHLGQFGLLQQRRQIRQSRLRHLCTHSPG